MRISYIYFIDMHYIQITQLWTKTEFYIHFDQFLCIQYPTIPHYIYINYMINTYSFYFVSFSIFQFPFDPPNVSLARFVFVRFRSFGFEFMF